MKFNTLLVSNIQQETSDCVSVSFTVPEPLREEYQYRAGQYLTLRFRSKDDDVRRAYSISSSPQEKELTISVKRVKGGMISNYILDNLKVGSRVEVMTPEGRFSPVLDETQRKTYYLLGAGSGITPLISILKTILEQEPMSSIHLLYGNRDENNIIFKDQLDALEQRYAGQLTVTHVLSQPTRQKAGGLTGIFKKATTNWTGKTGRIEYNQIVSFLEEHPNTNKMVSCFLCGPGNMIEAATAVLQQNGIDKKDIHFELFLSGKAQADKDAAPAGEGIPTTVHLKNQIVDILVPEGKTILDVLIAQKHDAPYSCTSGACSTCMAKVIKGSATMDACFALDDDEVAAGYILTCQAHPSSEKLEITYKV